MQLLQLENLGALTLSSHSCCGREPRVAKTAGALRMRGGEINTVSACGGTRRHAPAEAPLLIGSGVEQRAHAGVAPNGAKSAYGMRGCAFALKQNANDEENA